MRPILSIAIPTYNRAELLSFCVDRIQNGFSNKNLNYEIVISDNNSTDHTEEVVKTKIALGLPVKYFRRDFNDGPIGNYINVYRRCSGKYIIWLADDDSFDFDQVISYVKLFENDDSLVGIYTDWFAYNDESDSEIHRYWPQIQPAEFQPNQKLEMIHHIANYQLLIEQGIFRRKEFIDSYVPYNYGFAYYSWLYNLSNLGKIRFDPAPFYKENRVLKEGFSRGSHWSNQDIALHLIGDQMRIALEGMFFQLLPDYNQNSFDSVNRLKIVDYIDSWLHQRTWLEIQRAVSRKNWILAIELRRRQIMKSGLPDHESIKQDFQSITVPATLQSIHEIHQSMDPNMKLIFHGFRTNQIQDFYKQIYPNTEIIPDSKISDLSRDDILLITMSKSELKTVFNDTPGNLINFMTMLNCYRLSNLVSTFSNQF